MGKSCKTAQRNRSPTGWWIFCEVEQWVSDHQKTLSPLSRCPVWENLRLIRAKNRKKAYKKALKLGELGHPSRTNGGEWRFVGVSMLLPLYDEIEDGTELLWNDRGLMTVAKIQTLAKTRDQLPVFDDTEKAARPSVRPSLSQRKTAADTISSHQPPQ